MKKRLAAWADLPRHVPLGWNHRIQTQLFGYGLLLAVFISFVAFLFSFDSALNGLYRADQPSLLRIGAVMPDFVDLLGSAMMGFYALAACMALFAVLHYVYHYQGSKSIYLMRRLPARRELLRRCLALPLTTAVLCLLAALLLVHLYLLIYLLVTPKACLMPNQWLKIWSVIP